MAAGYSIRVPYSGSREGPPRKPLPHLRKDDDDQAELKQQRNAAMDQDAHGRLPGLTLASVNGFSNGLVPPPSDQRFERVKPPVSDAFGTSARLFVRRCEPAPVPRAGSKGASNSVGYRTNALKFSRTIRIERPTHQTYTGAGELGVLTGCMCSKTPGGHRCVAISLLRLLSRFFFSLLPMPSNQPPLPPNSRSRALTALLKLRPNLAWKLPATRNVSALRKDDQGIWRGTAMKDGKQVNVAVDFRGNITLS